MQHIQRALRILLASLLMLTLASPMSISSPVNKASGICPKIGKTAVINSIKYVCQKNGKKLIWVKKIAKPAPTPTPTPTPTPAPYQGLVNQAALSAFDSISDYLKATPDIPSGYVFMEMSPHAQQSLADATLKDLQKGAQFWQSFTSTDTKIHIVFADRSDMNWFQEKMTALLPNNTGWLERIVNSAQDQPTSQWAGSNGSDLQGNSLFFFLPGTQTVATSSGWQGVGPHEWTHSAQYAISGDTNRLPCWFKEGQAYLYGNAISNSSRSEWGKHWNYELKAIFWDFQEFYKMDASDLTIWFQKHSYDMPNNVCGPEGAYGIGSMATEYLVGAFGVDQVNKIVAELKTGAKWEPSLEKVTGKSNDEIMRGIIAHVLEVRKWMTPNP